MALLFYLHSLSRLTFATTPTAKNGRLHSSHGERLCLLLRFICFSRRRHSFNQVVTPSFVLTDYRLSESVALWSKEKPHTAGFGLHAKQ